MNMNKSPEGDESDEGVVRKKIKGLGEGGLEKSHLLLDDTSVDDEDENRGRRRECVVVVLDGGVVREELGGEIFVGDGGVVRREVVAVVAEGADPDLGDKIDDGEGVEDRAACAASERRVREERGVGEGLDGSVDGGDWDHAIGGFLLCAWQHIPGHSNQVLSLQLQEFRHFRCFFLIDRSRESVVYRIVT